MIVYGDSGVGKTTFAAGFPKPLLICPEKGLLSVAGQDLPYIEIEKWDEIEEVYLYLLKAESRKQYDTIVVDSLTDLQQRALSFILDANGREFPEQRDWGQLLEVMRRFLRQMGDLPYNLVFVCLAGTEKDELTGIVKERPAISGRLAVEAPAYVDIVMHMQVEKTGRGDDAVISRYAVFQPDNRAAAKDRSGKMPVVMKDPTADKVISRISGGSTSTKSAAQKRRRKTK